MEGDLFSVEQYFSDCPPGTGDEDGEEKAKKVMIKRKVFLYRQ